MYASNHRLETEEARPASNRVMEFREHARITGDALKRWFFAQLQDALCVAVIWLVGLLIIGVPFKTATQITLTTFESEEVVS